MKQKLASFLIFAALLGLASCGGGGEPVETTAPVPTELAVTSGEFSDFTIVRADMGKDAVVKAAVNLRKGITSATGARPNLTTDWEDNPITEHEIVVGNTTRDNLSGGIDRTAIGETGFIIREVDGRIFITGGSDKGTTLAVNYFLDTFVKPGKDVVVPIGYEYIVYHQYDIPALYVDQSLVDESWRVLYAADADKAAAMQLRDAIAKKTGVMMNVQKGTSGEKSFLLIDKKPTYAGVHEMHVEGSTFILSSSAKTGLSGCVEHFIKNYFDGKLGQYNFPADFCYLEVGDYLTVSYPEG